MIVVKVKRGDSQRHKSLIQVYYFPLQTDIDEFMFIYLNNPNDVFLVIYCNIMAYHLNTKTTQRDKIENKLVSMSK